MIQPETLKNSGLGTFFFGWFAFLELARFLAPQDHHLMSLTSRIIICLRRKDIESLEEEEILLHLNILRELD
jgi:hypothetical protein